MTHGTTCPICKTIYTDEFEKDFIEQDGMCSHCEKDQLMSNQENDDVDFDNYISKY